jgi:hypothetical protein
MFSGHRNVSDEISRTQLRDITFVQPVKPFLRKCLVPIIHNVNLVHVVLTAVKTVDCVLMFVMPCRLVCGCQLVGGMYCS